MLDNIYMNFTEEESNQEELLKIQNKCDIYKLSEVFNNEELFLIEETITNYCQEYFKLGFKEGIKLVGECIK